MRNRLIAVSLVVFAGVGTSACATKGYVRTQVTQVSTKVDTLGQALEATKQRTLPTETKLGEVDGKAGAAQTAATQAGTAAAGASRTLPELAGRALPK